MGSDDGPQFSTMRHAIHACLPIVATLALAHVAALAQVVETSNGKVEFIGLEKWTPATIQEKLGYASPDKFHFCATDLKERLKFADTSVTVDRENAKRYTIIAVVEPDHAQRIRIARSRIGQCHWRDRDSSRHA